MECMSLVGGSMSLQWPLLEAHFSPVSQQVCTSSLADTAFKHKHQFPDLSRSVQPAFQGNYKMIQLEGGCRIHHHRIPSVPRSKILQAIYVGSECLVPKVDLGDWRSSGIAKNRLCFSPQLLALTSRRVWKPRLYKRALRVKRFVTSWIIRAGAERQSRTLTLHFSMGQGKGRRPCSRSYDNRRCILSFDLCLLTTVKHTTHDVHAFSQSIKPQSCYQRSWPTKRTEEPLKVPDSATSRHTVDFIV